MKTLFVLSVFAWLMTCWPGQSPSLQKAGAWNVLPPSIDGIAAREVLEEVNALRARGCNCPGGRRFAPTGPLHWDEKLEQAAQTHADDMSRRRYFSHTSKDGTIFSARISRAGYDWNVVGENIAKGYPTARAVVEGWRSSKDHCPNLLNPKFRDMGVGKTGPYWVQDLGARH